MELRPHIMTWTIKAGSIKDPVTHYLTPGIPGTPVYVLCRFHLGGIKEFMNQDNKTVIQKGKIRLDPGTELPPVGQRVKIFETQPVEVGGSAIVIDGVPVFTSGIVHFEGEVLDIYRGQLSFRIDV